MGPVFNPVYWFASLVILVVAILAAGGAGVATRALSSRLPHGDGTAHPGGRRLAWAVALLAFCLTFCGLCSWTLSDPSSPRTKPARHEIVGVWSPSASSLEKMQEEGGYEISTHTLTFRDDGTLEVTNMPDWWLEVGGHSWGGFLSGSGRWEIVKESGAPAVGGLMSSRRRLLLTSGSLLSVIAGVACIACIAILISVMQRGNRRNEKLLGPDSDAEISEELNALAQPTIEALYEYQLDHGSYPEKVGSLVPTYIEKVPSSYMDGRLVYNRRASYGAPFYFAFRGNYSGKYSWHGWSFLYCPISICTVEGPGTRRIDDTWVFIHSSAL